MRVWFREVSAVCLLPIAGFVFGQEVEITVFTLKDGRQVEAISFASGMQEGERVHSVTTTTGERTVLLGKDVVRKESIKKDASRLPEFARKKLESREKARQEWAARAAAERKAEEEKRRTAHIRAAEIADEGKVLRQAELEERTIRQRCAALWEAHQKALRGARGAQEAIRQAHFDYRDAVEDLRSLDHWRVGTPEERARWRFLRLRAERRIAGAQEDIQKGERQLQLFTQQANQLAAQLAESKAVLGRAEEKVAEARSRYEEARQRFKQPVEPLADSVIERTQPKPPAGKAQGPSVDPAGRTTVARTIGKGEFVQLADGSLWEIHPEDRLIASGWEREQEISAVPGADPKYAHRLINSSTKMVVKAQKLK